MIFEDERAAEQDRLGFVLHLGDFIYEIVWYPEDRPQGMYDRKLRVNMWDNHEFSWLGYQGLQIFKGVT